MLKNLSQLTHTIAGKAYTFVCDVDSTLENIKESLFQFQKYVGQIEDQVKAQQEAAKAAIPEPVAVVPEAPAPAETPPPVENPQ